MKSTLSHVFSFHWLDHFVVIFTANEHVNKCVKKVKVKMNEIDKKKIEHLNRKSVDLSEKMEKQIQSPAGG